MSEVEIWEAIEQSIKGQWEALYAKGRPGLTMQQQGERNAYNHGIFKSMEALRAFVLANKAHAERREG